MSYSDVDEDSRSAQGAFIARRDVEEQNRKNRALYNAREHSEADHFKSLVDAAFYRRRTFLNYRETFITVKIEAPKSMDQYSTEYRDVISFAQNKNYIMKKGRASIIFELCHK